MIFEHLLVSMKRKERRKNYASSKKAPHINQGKGATWEEKPLHQKRKKQSVRIRRVAVSIIFCRI